MRPRIPLDVSKGEVVHLPQYGGTEIKYNGEEYLILSARDFAAVPSTVIALCPPRVPRDHGRFPGRHAFALRNRHMEQIISFERNCAPRNGSRRRQLATRFV